MSKTYTWRKTLVGAVDNDGENPIVIYVESFDYLAVVFLDGIEECGRLILAAKNDKNYAVELAVQLANSESVEGLVERGKKINALLEF